MSLALLLISCGRGPPALGTTTHPCAPADPATSLLAVGAEGGSEGPAAWFRLHRSGRVEASYTTDVQGSICPVSRSTHDAIACLDPAAVAPLFDAGPVGGGDRGLCLVDPTATALPDGATCRGARTAAQIRSLLRDRIATDDDAACAGAGGACGLVLEHVELQHSHHTTSFHFVAELWRDGRWRCEGPGRPEGLHVGRCAEYHLDVASGRLSAEAGAALFGWLVGDRTVDDLADQPVDGIVMADHADFARARVLLDAPTTGRLRQQSADPGRGPLVSSQARRAGTPRLYRDTAAVGSLVLTDATARSIEARWAKIARRLDPRCLPPGADPLDPI